MSDKPKRKRSERAKPERSKRLLYWLTLIYCLFLSPNLVEMESVLSIAIALLFAVGVLWIGNKFVKIPSISKNNFLVYLILLLTATFAFFLLTLPAIRGLALIEMFSSPYMSYSRPYEIIMAVLGLMLPILGILFTVSLQFAMLESMDAVRGDAVKKKRAKVASRSLSNELEPDIPLELLAESASIEQVQR